MSYKVVLVGASGLIGSNLLSVLMNSKHISDILIISRKDIQISNPKIRQLIINFDDLNDHAENIKGDIIFSCLGTTRSNTPDLSLYKRIDLEYPLLIARHGLKNGISQFHIVSSIGANITSDSSYLKLKGELELELKKLGLPSLHIYQPSYLTGNRKEYRTFDKIITPFIRLIDPLLTGPLKKYRSIPAETVAKAMLNQSLKNLKGSFTYTSINIKQLA